MATVTFDTLKFAARLEQAGASRELAAALAEAQKDALAEALDSSLATKPDVHGLRLDVAGMKSDVAPVRGEMATLKWMMGAPIAIAIANFAKQFFRRGQGLVCRLAHPRSARQPKKGAGSICFPIPCPERPRPEAVFLVRLAVAPGARLRGNDKRSPHSIQASDRSR